MRKIDGKKNNTDIHTKHLDGKEFERQAREQGLRKLSELQLTWREVPMHQISSYTNVRFQGATIS